MIENNKEIKLNCEKKQPKGRIVALSSVTNPSNMILDKLKEFNVSSLSLIHI